MHTLVTRLPPVSTPLTQVIYSPCIHHTHAFVARGQRKCQLIYSRYLLWEHSLLTEDKSTGAAHLPLLSFLPYPKIYTWRCLNLLTREAIPAAEISTSAISFQNAPGFTLLYSLNEFIYSISAAFFFASPPYKVECRNLLFGWKMRYRRSHWKLNVNFRWQRLFPRDCSYITNEIRRTKRASFNGNMIQINKSYFLETRYYKRKSSSQESATRLDYRFTTRFSALPRAYFHLHSPLPLVRLFFYDWPSTVITGAASNILFICVCIYILGWKFFITFARRQ